MDMQTNRRALLGAMALAPIAGVAATVPAASVSPGQSAFDAALANYYRLRDEDNHDAKGGELQAAYDRYDRLMAPLIIKHGDRNLAVGDDKARWEEHWKEMTAAETRHAETFSTRRWDAFDALLAVPAPTIEAMLLKVDLVEDEPITPEDFADFVKADLKHLRIGGRN